jgi:hypothetical protein
MKSRLSEQSLKGAEKDVVGKENAVEIKRSLVGMWLQLL